MDLSFLGHGWVQVLLLGFVADALAGHEDVASQTATGSRIDLTVAEPSRAFTEEERSRMPTVFSVLRSVVLGAWAEAAGAVA